MGSSPTLSVKTSASLDKRSRDLRRTVIDIFAQCGRGHVGSTFSLIEILRVLYDDILRYDPQNPKKEDRDRCILSKGHGCLALYVILSEKGFFPREELFKFCKTEGILGGHPEIKTPGVEASTGSLGHGLSIGLGMALNAKHEKATYRTFVIVGDGECNEGSIWEAAMCAAKHKLQNLTVVIDYNKHQSYSSTQEVLDLGPLADKWKAFGFSVAEVDGHDVHALKKVLSQIPLEQNKPTAIICHTIKGRGFSFVENNMKWHHKTKFSEEEIQAFLKELVD